MLFSVSAQRSTIYNFSFPYCNYVLQQNAFENCKRANLNTLYNFVEGQNELRLHFEVVNCGHQIGVAGWYFQRFSSNKVRMH